jgi:dTDP-4-dehydrorhamnose reductase
MILLIGSTGYIGSEFTRQLTENGEDFRTVSYSEVLKNGFESYLNGIRFVINASGYTGKPNVDKAEEEKDKCILGNIIIPMKLVEYCKKKDILYGHVSSGCIYTGKREDGNAFEETDEPNFDFKHNNCSFYSGTKSMAEDIVKQYKKSWIWRLRIPFDEEDNPRNYLSKLLNYSKLIDYENSVSHRKEFVTSCLLMVQENAPFGVYNVVNTGTVTTQKVTEWINEYLYPNKKFDFFESENVFYNTVAKVPRSNCVLSNKKLLRLRIPMRSAENAIIDSLKNWKTV